MRTCRQQLIALQPLADLTVRCSQPPLAKLCCRPASLIAEINNFVTRRYRRLGILYGRVRR